MISKMARSPSGATTPTRDFPTIPDTSESRRYVAHTLQFSDKREASSVVPRTRSLTIHRPPHLRAFSPPVTGVVLVGSSAVEPRRPGLILGPVTEDCVRARVPPRSHCAS